MYTCRKAKALHHFGAGPLLYRIGKSVASVLKIDDTMEICAERGPLMVHIGDQSSSLTRTTTFM